MISIGWWSITQVQLTGSFDQEVAARNFDANKFSNAWTIQDNQKENKDI